MTTSLGLTSDNVPPSRKTPRYDGKADREAFHGQLELLLQASRWSTDVKALVDTSLLATLLKPALVMSTVVLPTIMTLQRSTGDHTPIVGEATVTLGWERKKFAARCGWQT